MSKTLQWAISRILDITAGSFFGSVTLTFMDGNLVKIDHHRSEKPPIEEAVRG